MLTDYSFNTILSTTVRYGLHIVREELVHTIQQMKKDKVFIATDRGLVETGIVKKITTMLESNGIQTFVFSKVEPNPRAETIMKGSTFYNKHNCQLMLAIGGGSSIDFAKAVGVVVTHSGHILDYRRGGTRPIVENIPPLIAIPTTVGTGSEVTSVSIVTDKTSGRKYGVASTKITPEIAFIDPSLTLTLPKQLVSATGIDALVHAIEAYTSIRATPISDSFALQAMKMLKDYLYISYTEPHNIEARAQIHMASTIAGMAFSLAGLCLVHSCSHPLSAIYDVPHGVANAVLLPHVIEYNLRSDERKFATIARLFDRSLVEVNNRQAANELPNLLSSLNQSLEMPIDFQYLNIVVTDDVINRLAMDALDDRGTIPNNPRKVNKEAVVKIYEKVLPR